MFTDIVGFTALSQTNEAQALEVLERHNRLLETFFPKFRGRQIKTVGDSFLVEFESALDALNCALEIQNFLHDYNVAASEQWKIKLRIGIHLGDVVRKGDDIFGDAVNIASRIQPLATPEGICISQQVFDQVHNKIACKLEQLPKTEMKNVRFQTNVFAIVMPWEQRAGRSQIDVEGVDRLRVAVLPFSSMSPDPNDEYFADGITEELISTISKIQGLQVIARTSVLRYKGGSKSIDEIGRELRAGSILEGSVRKAGRKLRITAQLIDSKENLHVWSETYDRELDDIFAIQTEVAQSVASKLKLKFFEKNELAKGTLNSDAHALYLEGLYHKGYSRGELERNLEDINRAIKCFEKAIELDPNFALAYAGLADCYNNLGTTQFVSPAEALPKSSELSQKALELDYSVAEAHESLARVLKVYYWDFVGAEREFRLAIKLNPNLASARAGYSDLMLILGRYDESLVELEAALERDPLSLDIRTELGRLYSLTGRYDEALVECNRVLAMDGTHISAYEWITIAYAGKGKYSEALEATDRFMPLFKGQIAKMAKARIYSILGRQDEVRKLRDEVFELSKKEYTTPLVLAAISKLAGDSEEAVRLLDEAYKTRAGELIYLRSHKFYFDVFYAEPRFIALENKIGLTGKKLKES